MAQSLQHSRTMYAVCFLCQFTAVAGCGPATATVTGQVTFEGQPLSCGQITFLCKDGRVASGRINSDGDYTIAGAPVGPVTVLVVSQPPRPILITEGTQTIGVLQPDTGELGTEDQPPRPSPFVPIPDRYNIASQSGLSYTIQSGPQTFNISLKP